MIVTFIVLSQLSLLHFVVTFPLDHGLGKRNEIRCFPNIPPQPFNYLDCVNAANDINRGGVNNNVPYVFGTDVGATHTDDVYSWQSGLSMHRL